jgi:hypothetical protein
MNSKQRFHAGLFCFALVLSFTRHYATAQQTLGAITGTVKDVSGAVMPDVTVKARNIGTNLEVTEHTQTNGS